MKRMSQVLVAALVWMAMSGSPTMAQEREPAPFEEDRVEHPPSHPTYVDRRGEIALQSTAGFLVSSWFTYQAGAIAAGFSSKCDGPRECEKTHAQYIATLTVVGTLSALPAVWLSGRSNGSTSNCLSSTMLTLAMGTTLGLASSAAYYSLTGCREREGGCWESRRVLVPMSLIMAASTTAGAVIGYQLSSSWRGGLRAPSQPFYKFSWSPGLRRDGGVLQVRVTF